MADPWMQPKNKSKYWNNMLKKYEERNARLQSEECELRHKLEALEYSLPMMMYMNMNQPQLNQPQPINQPNSPIAAMNNSGMPIRDVASDGINSLKTPYCSCTDCSKAKTGECDCKVPTSKDPRITQNQQRPQSSGSASAPRIQPNSDRKGDCTDGMAPERAPQHTVSLPAKFPNEACPCENCVLMPLGQCDCGIEPSNDFCPCEDCELLAQGVCDCGPQNEVPGYSSQPNPFVPQTRGLSPDKPVTPKGPSPINPKTTTKPFKPCDCKFKEMRKSSKISPMAPNNKKGAPPFEEEIKITNPLHKDTQDPNSAPWAQSPHSTPTSAPTNRFHPSTPGSSTVPNAGMYPVSYPQPGGPSWRNPQAPAGMPLPVTPQGKQNAKLHPQHATGLPERFSNDKCNCRNCQLIETGECDCPSESSSVLPSSSDAVQHQNDDVSLLDSEDFLIIERVKHLAEKEKALKQNINELNHKENALNETIETVQFLRGIPPIMDKNNPALTNKIPAEDNQGNLMDNLQRLNNSLVQENTRLSDELADVKLDTKQMKERLEGPIQRELEREKRKNKNLEDDLNRAKEDSTRSEDLLKKELDFLKMQLEAAAAQNTDLNTINDRLKDELNLMDAKYNELHEDLVNQKISEANTLSRMKAAQAPAANVVTGTPHNLTPVAQGAARLEQQSEPSSAHNALSPPIETVHNVSFDELADPNSNDNNALEKTPPNHNPIINMALIEQETPDFEKSLHIDALGEKDFKDNPTPKDHPDVNPQAISERRNPFDLGNDINSVPKEVKDGKPVKITTKPNKPRDKMRDGSSLNNLARDLSDLLHENENNVNIPKNMKDTAFEIKALVDIVDKKLAIPPSHRVKKDVEPAAELYKRKPTSEPEGKLRSENKIKPDKINSVPPIPTAVEPAEDTEFEDAVEELPKEISKTPDNDENIQAIEVETFVSDLDATKEYNIEKPFDKQQDNHPLTAKSDIKPNQNSPTIKPASAEQPPAKQAVPIDTKIPSPEKSPKSPRTPVMPKEIDVETRLQTDANVDINTEVMIVKKNLDGINVTTTLTRSGTLEVITEGPAGLIDTVMKLTDSGNIEVVTEITDYDDVKSDKDEDSEEETTTDTDTDQPSKKDNADNDDDDQNDQPKPGNGGAPGAGLPDDSTPREDGNNENNERNNDNEDIPYVENNSDSRFQQAAINNTFIPEKIYPKKLNKVKAYRKLKTKSNNSSRNSSSPRISDLIIDNGEGEHYENQHDDAAHLINLIKKVKADLTPGSAKASNQNKFVVDDLSNTFNELQTLGDFFAKHTFSKEILLKSIGNESFTEITDIFSSPDNRKENVSMLSLTNIIQRQSVQNMDMETYGDVEVSIKTKCSTDDVEIPLGISKAYLNLFRSISPTTISVCATEASTDLKSERELEEITFDIDVISQILDARLKLLNAACSKNIAKEMIFHNKSSVRVKLAKSDTNTVGKICKEIQSSKLFRSSSVKQQSISEQDLKMLHERQCNKARGDKADTQQINNHNKTKGSTLDLHSKDYFKSLYMNSIKPITEIQVAVNEEAWHQLKLSKEDVEKLNIRTLFQSSSSIEKLIEKYSSGEYAKKKLCCDDSTGTYAAALRKARDVAEQDNSSEKIGNNLDKGESMSINSKSINTIPADANTNKQNDKKINNIVKPIENEIKESLKSDKIDKVIENDSAPQGDGFRKSEAITENIPVPPVKISKPNIEKKPSKQSKLNEHILDKTNVIKQDLDPTVKDKESLEDADIVGKLNPVDIVTSDRKSDQKVNSEIDTKDKSDNKTQNIKVPTEVVDTKIPQKDSHNTSKIKTDMAKSPSAVEDKPKAEKKISDVKNLSKDKKIPSEAIAKNLTEDVRPTQKASNVTKEIIPDKPKVSSEVLVQIEPKKIVSQLKNEEVTSPVASVVLDKIEEEQKDNVEIKPTNAFSEDNAKQQSEIIIQSKPEKVAVETSDIVKKSSESIVNGNENTYYDPTQNISPVSSEREKESYAEVINNKMPSIDDTKLEEHETKEEVFLNDISNKSVSDNPEEMSKLTSKEDTDEILEKEAIDEINKGSLKEDTSPKIIDKVKEQKPKEDEDPCTCDICNCIPIEIVCKCAVCNCEPEDLAAAISGECTCKPGYCKCTAANSIITDKECDCKPGSCQCIAPDSAGIETNESTKELECGCKPGYCSCIDEDNKSKSDTITPETFIQETECKCKPDCCICSTKSNEKYADAIHLEDCSCKLCVCPVAESKENSINFNDKNKLDACICEKCNCSSKTSKNKSNNSSSSKNKSDVNDHGSNCSCNTCACPSSQIKSKEYKIVHCSCCTCKQCDCPPKSIHSYATDTRSNTFEKYKNSTSIEGDQTLLNEINKKQDVDCVCRSKACECLPANPNGFEKDDKTCPCETCSCTLENPNNGVSRGVNIKLKQAHSNLASIEENENTIYNEHCICAPFDCTCGPREVFIRSTSLENNHGATCNCDKCVCVADENSYNQIADGKGCPCDPLNSTCANEIEKLNAMTRLNEKEICSCAKCDCPVEQIHHDEECICSTCLCEKRSNSTVDCKCESCKCVLATKTQPPKTRSINTVPSSYVDCICSDCKCIPAKDQSSVACYCKRCTCSLKEDMDASIHKTDKPASETICICAKCDCPVEQINHDEECNCKTCLCEKRSNSTVDCKCESCKCISENKTEPQKTRSINTVPSSYVDCICSECKCIPAKDQSSVACSCKRCTCSLKDDIDSSHKIDKPESGTICICVKCDCPAEHIILDEECICKICLCEKRSNSTVDCKCESCKCISENKTEPPKTRSINTVPSTYVDCICSDCKCIPAKDQSSVTCSCERCTCSIKEDMDASIHKTDKPESGTICICAKCDCPVEHDGECKCNTCLCEKRSNSTVDCKCESCKCISENKTEPQKTRSINTVPSSYVDCICSDCKCIPAMDQLSVECTCKRCTCSLKENMDASIHKTDTSASETICICAKCDCPVEHDGECNCNTCLCEKHSNSGMDCKCESCKCISENKTEPPKTKSINTVPSTYVDCICSDCKCIPAMDQLSVECTCKRCTCSIKEDMDASVHKIDKPESGTICICAKCECPVEQINHDGKCNCNTCLCEKNSNSNVDCKCEFCKCISEIKTQPPKTNSISTVPSIYVDCICSDCKCIPANDQSAVACTCKRCTCSLKDGSKAKNCTCDPDNCLCQQSSDIKSNQISNENIKTATNDDNVIKSESKLVSIKSSDYVDCICPHCSCMTSLDKLSVTCTCEKCTCLIKEDASASIRIKDEPKFDSNCTCTKCECLVIQTKDEVKECSCDPANCLCEDSSSHKQFAYVEYTCAPQNCTCEYHEKSVPSAKSSENVDCTCTTCECVPDVDTESIACTCDKCKCGNNEMGNVSFVDKTKNETNHTNVTKIEPPLENAEDKNIDKLNSISNRSDLADSKERADIGNNNLKLDSAKASSDQYKKEEVSSKLNIFQTILSCDKLNNSIHVEHNSYLKSLLEYGNDSIEFKVKEELKESNRAVLKAIEEANHKVNIALQRINKRAESNHKIASSRKRKRTRIPVYKGLSQQNSLEKCNRSGIPDSCENISEKESLSQYASAVSMIGENVKSSMYKAQDGPYSRNNKSGDTLSVVGKTSNNKKISLNNKEPLTPTTSLSSRSKYNSATNTSNLIIKTEKATTVPSNCFKIDCALLSFATQTVALKQDKSQATSISKFDLKNNTNEIATSTLINTVDYSVIEEFEGQSFDLCNNIGLKESNKVTEIAKPLINHPTDTILKENSICKVTSENSCLSNDNAHMEEVYESCKSSIRHLNTTDSIDKSNKSSRANVDAKFSTAEFAPEDWWTEHDNLTDDVHNLLNELTEMLPLTENNTVQHIKSKIENHFRNTKATRNEDETSLFKETDNIMCDTDAASLIINDSAVRTFSEAESLPSDHVIAFIPKLNNNCSIRSYNGSVSKIIARKSSYENSVFKYPIKLSDVQCIYFNPKDIKATSSKMIGIFDPEIRNANNSETMKCLNYEDQLSNKNSADISNHNEQGLQLSSVQDDILDLSKSSESRIIIQEELIETTQSQNLHEYNEKLETVYTLNESNCLFLKYRPQTLITNIHHMPMLPITSENNEIVAHKISKIHESDTNDSDDEWADALEMIPHHGDQITKVIDEVVPYHRIISVDATEQTSDVRFDSENGEDANADHGISCECIDCLTAPCPKTFAVTRPEGEPVIECPMCNRIECIGDCETLYQFLVQHSDHAQSDSVGVTQSHEIYHKCILSDCLQKVGNGLQQNGGGGVYLDFRSLPCVMNAISASNKSTEFQEISHRVPSYEGDVQPYYNNHSPTVQDLYISDNKEINKSDEDLDELQNIMKQISSACMKAGSRIPVSPVYYQNSSTNLKIALKNLQTTCNNKDSVMKAMICELQMRLENKNNASGEVSENFRQNQNYQPTEVRNLSKEEFPQKQMEQNTYHSSYESVVDIQKRCNSRSRSNRTRSNRSSGKISSQQITQEASSNCHSKEAIIQMTEVKRIGDASLLVKWQAPANKDILGYEVCVNEKVKTRVYTKTRTMAVINAIPLDRYPIVNISVYGCTDKGRCFPPALASIHI